MNNSIFNEAYSSYIKSKLKKRLDEKYKAKPFYKKYKDIRLFTFCGSYLLNVFSALTAFTFVFFFTLTFSDAITAFIITLFILFIIEFSKRTFLPFGIKEILTSGLSISSAIKIALVLGLSTFSIVLSYNGAERAISQFKKDPPKISVDSVKSEYQAQIAALEQKQEKISNTQLWKGKITADGQKALLLIENELGQLRSKKLDEIALTKEKNMKTLSLHNKNKGYEAYIFALITLTLEILFILCIVFLELYDYKAYNEFKAVRELSKNNKTGPKSGPKPGPKKPMNQHNQHSQNHVKQFDSNINKPPTFTIIDHKNKNNENFKKD